MLEYNNCWNILKTSIKTGSFFKPPKTNMEQVKKNTHTHTHTAWFRGDSVLGFTIIFGWTNQPLIFVFFPGVQATHIIDGRRPHALLEAEPAEVGRFFTASLVVWDFHQQFVLNLVVCCYFQNYGIRTSIFWVFFFSFSCSTDIVERHHQQNILGYPNSLCPVCAARNSFPRAAANKAQPSVTWFLRIVQVEVWPNMGVSKNRGGKTPPNHPLNNRVFHYFHHPF